MQLPSLHVELGSLQSVSNTQAKAGVEVRQRIVITIRLRMVVPLLEPSQNHITECPNLDRLRLVVTNEEIALRSQIPLPQRTSPGTG